MREAISLRNTRPLQRSRLYAVVSNVRVVETSGIRVIAESRAADEFDPRMLRSMIGRAVFGFAISLTGAGILIGFAAVGAVGIVGQRCAALWVAPGANPTRTA